MSLLNHLSRLSFVQNYRRMIPYVRPYWGRALLALLITLPIGSMDAVIAWVLKPYMDIVMIEKSVRATSFIPLLIVVFSLTQSLLNYGATYLNAWVGNRITMDLKYDLFQKMMRYEPAFFDASTSGDIQFRFNNDVDLACNGLLRNLKMFTTRLFSSVSLIFVLFYNSWQLALLALAVLLGALYPLATVRRKIDGIMKDTVFSGARVMTHYNEAFAGNRIISSYNLYDRQRQVFLETLRHVFKLGMKMTKKTGLMSPMMHFIISLGIAGVIWMGSWLIVHNQLTPGGFVSFITALLMLYHPIKAIGSNFTNVQMALMAMERVFELMGRQPPIAAVSDALPMPEKMNSIRYDDVSFSYASGPQVLHHITLDIPVGRTTAFVGPSGGGKTTLVNLLPRFYEVSDGAVCIDGQDIRQFDLDGLRDRIAIVFQDNFLFAGTIRQNILLGRPDASENDIIRAVQCACLEDFIRSLPQGLDTEIGERGILLSGGQKQRVAIARAFLKNAPIVILDEATSALDNQAEAIVQQALNNLMTDRTVLAIAHRLSTIRHADKIVVVAQGRVQETGTHEELLSDNASLYAALWRAQIS